MAKLITDQNYYTPNWISGKTPSNPQHGDVWFDTTEKKLKVFRNQENLLKYSETMTNSAWTKSNGTITASGTGYTSKYNAFNFTDSSTTYSGVVYQDYYLTTVGDVKPRTFSVDVKKATNTSTITIGLSYVKVSTVTSSAILYFNLLTGEIGSFTKSLSNAKYSIETLQDDWYRISITNYDTGTSNGSTSFCRGYVFATDNTIPANTGDVLLSRPQLSETTNPIEYIKTAATTKTYKKWYVVDFGTRGGDRGFICGGYTGSVLLSSITKINMSSDYGVSNYGNLTSSRQYSFAACNSSVSGFVFGGLISSGTTATSVIDKFLFSNDSGTASIGNTFSTTKLYSTAVNNSLYGYTIAGEHVTTIISTISRYTFSTDAVDLTVSSISYPRCYLSSCNSSNYAFSLGGFQSTSTYFSTISRITFANVATVTDVGNLNINKFYTYGLNSSSRGYVVGGKTSANISSIEQLSFPFNTGSSTTSNSVMTSSICRSSAANSNSVGLIFGGYTSEPISAIQLFLFPFDGGSTTNLTSLSTSNDASAACDNTDFVSQFV